jgi:hypothetical protein
MLSRSLERSIERRLKLKIRNYFYKFKRHPMKNKTPPSINIISFLVKKFIKKNKRLAIK